MADPDSGQPAEQPPARAVALLELAEELPPVIETEEALRGYCRALAAGEGPVAIDAERASGYRYTQRAYLVQLRRAGAGTVLIDPLPLDDLRTTLARWRSQAQNECVTTAHPTDLEWLSGRIRALGDVTAATLYIQMLINPVDTIVAILDELQSGAASLARLLGVAQVRSPGADVGDEVLDALELPFSSAHMRRNAMAVPATTPRC